MLYRVFRWTPGAAATVRGGPLYVPRERQGSGRHDSPGRYGAFYAARSPEGAVAESIQAFRGRDLTDADLELADGSVLALAALDDQALEHRGRDDHAGEDRGRDDHARDDAPPDHAPAGALLDLDDPSVLVREVWRPSQVASRERVVTQAQAVRIFEAGALGLSWWSTLDAAWTNVTLFAERTTGLGLLRMHGDIERLSVGHPAVVTAADHLAIPLLARRRRGG